MNNFISLALIAFLFCAIHHIMASFWFKGFLGQVFGEMFYTRYYRFIFSGIAAITLLGVLTYNHTLADRTLWHIETAFPFRLIQGLGVGIMLWASRAFDLLEFIGISQALKWKKPSISKTKLTTTGAYHLCRHPLYLGTILFLWAQPHISQNHFLLVVVVTLYFYLGSFPEEKKLEGEFGEEYRQYQRQTPRFIPHLGLF